MHGSSLPGKPVSPLLQYNPKGHNSRCQGLGCPYLCPAPPLDSDTQQAPVSPSICQPPACSTTDGARKAWPPPPRGGRGLGLSGGLSPRALLPQRLHGGTSPAPCLQRQPGAHLPGRAAGRAAGLGDSSRCRYRAGPGSGSAQPARASSLRPRLRAQAPLGVRLGKRPPGQRSERIPRAATGASAAKVPRGGERFPHPTGQERQQQGRGEVAETPWRFLGLVSQRGPAETPAPLQSHSPSHGCHPNFVDQAWNQRASPTMQINIHPPPWTHTGQIL